MKINLLKNDYYKFFFFKHFTSGAMHEHRTAPDGDRSRLDPIGPKDLVGYHIVSHKARG